MVLSRRFLDVKQNLALKGTYKYADPKDTDQTLRLEQGTYLIEEEDMYGLTIHYGHGYLVHIDRLDLKTSQHYTEILEKG